MHPEEVLVGEADVRRLLRAQFPVWADRQVFRRTSGCDGATWERGKGWALAIALSAWPYYRHTNPAMVTRARRMIDAVLST